MDRLPGKPTAPLRPLVGADGHLDPAAIEAWMDDAQSYKVLAGSELAALGVATGDMLVTDPEAPLDVGDVAALTDLESGVTYLARVERDAHGRLAASSPFGPVCVEPDAEDGLDLLVQRLVGVLPMSGVEGLPSRKDLAAVRPLRIPSDFALAGYPVEDLPF